MSPPRVFPTLILACLLSAFPSSARGQRVDEFPALNGASGIVRGPDGALWFVELGGSSIGRLTIAGEVSRVVSLGDLGRIAWGPDGNLWFTQSRPRFFGSPALAAVGRMTPAGVVTRYLLPVQSSSPYAIAAGPDGNMWFTEQNAIGRITPDGRLTEFVLNFRGSPFDIIGGPDGNVWFAADGIGRITPSGEFTEFPLPAPATYANSLTQGPDGNIWFTGGNRDLSGFVGRITMEGVIFTVPYPDLPSGIDLGPDGNLWFTANLALPGLPESSIGRVTPAGVISKVLTLDGRDLGKIVAGPDRNLWFTEGNRGIGRLAIQTSGSCVPDSTTLCLSGDRFRAAVAFRTAALPPAPGTGYAVPLSPDAGAFWFFSSGNLEVVVKVVDGRPVNERFWAFVAGLTDVEYELTVTDTFTGAIWTHRSRPGTLASFADTGAFGR